MTMIMKAIEYAKEKHFGQLRRGTGEPYVNHPIAVSYLVEEYKDSERIDELIIAALLHDCLEDTDATTEEIAEIFTPLVASLVEELTNDQSEIDRIGKLAYQKNKLVNMTGYGLIIKLADRLHNISDDPTRKMIADTIELMEHLSSHRLLTEAQAAMIFQIQSLCLFKIMNREHKKKLKHSFLAKC